MNEIEKLVYENKHDIRELKEKYNSMQLDIKCIRSDLSEIKDNFNAISKNKKIWAFVFFIGMFIGVVVNDIALWKQIIGK